LVIEDAMVLGATGMSTIDHQSQITNTLALEEHRPLFGVSPYMAMYNARMVRRPLKGLVGLLLLVLLPACLQLACSSRDVGKDLKIVDARTGWYDAGIVDGKNKIVPSIAFRLQNVSQEEIARVQVNAVFYRIDETAPWGDYYAPAIGSDGLQPTATGNELVLRGTLGYTSEDQSRAEILADHRFVDVKVQVFGKHGSRTWVKMGEFPIERKLLTAARK
jgi:hypothetical protein